MELDCHLLDSSGVHVATARVTEPLTHHSMKFCPVFDRPVLVERNKTYRICIIVSRPTYFLSGIAFSTFKILKYYRKPNNR